ncbi:hypothetical protein [Methylobacterium brachiatum]|uniref:hypothetical protein n=1 Tax=Methylobacterium brachiatum TaxID=269660 RepID=UPI000EFA33B8|nr:hypothetical protein [Methylobacterium brachiatum]AYO85353.1 hypothetical protein EBB05_26095 [Methylobacterium brachiatum]
MTVRGSSSVMASRREPPDSLDFFPTPPWATRALLVEVLPQVCGHLHLLTAWDPACGEGHIVEVLAEQITFAKGSDVFDYGRGYPVADFLDADTRLSPGADLICTNPPFNAAVKFALKALDEAPVVALLLRTAWIEGEGRYEALFRDRPPTVFAPFVERVPMLRGRWDPAASTATAYAWFVWVDGEPARAPLWIPPGQKRMRTRPDDARRFGVAVDAPLFDLVAAE